MLIFLRPHLLTRIDMCISGFHHKQECSSTHSHRSSGKM